MRLELAIGRDSYGKSYVSGLRKFTGTLWIGLSLPRGFHENRQRFTLLESSAFVDPLDFIIVKSIAETRLLSSLPVSVSQLTRKNDVSHINDWVAVLRFALVNLAFKIPVGDLKKDDIIKLYGKRSNFQFDATTLA
ncbi:hypothetical protein L218DRAFT_949536 [Marasmius fiardii PR-910]|nr:hypothetical protein L218DRAFT_949536 [Marasmius fiardii PR-910]